MIANPSNNSNTKVNKNPVSPDIILLKKLTEAKRRIQDQNQKISTLKKDLHTKTAQLEEKNKQEKARQKEIKSLQRDLTKSQKSQKRLEEKIVRLEKTIKDLREKNKALRNKPKKPDTKREEVKAIQAKLTETKRKYWERTDELEEARKRISGLQKALQESQNECKRLSERLAESEIKKSVFEETPKPLSFSSAILDSGSELEKALRENARLKEALAFVSDESAESFMNDLTSPIYKKLVKRINSLSKEVSELKEKNAFLESLSLKPGSEFPIEALVSFNRDLMDRLAELFNTKKEKLVITEPLLSEFKRAFVIVEASSSLAEELSIEEIGKVNELEERKRKIQEEKKTFNKEENLKIKNLEADIKDSHYQDLKEERSQKYQQDKIFNETIAGIENEEAQIIGHELTKEEKETLKAIDNTIKENDRKNDRSSKSSSTPPSQQGLNKPNNSLPESLRKKRGAPAGHRGYRFDFDGLNLSGLDEDKLRELSEKFPVETVYLTPEDIPEGAQIRNKSTRIAFGMIKRPCVLVYVQQEAVCRNPENRKQLIKKTASYPDWLKKDYTYSPDYHTEALFLRMQLHSSYGGIARYFNESYGLPTTAKSVWNWVHQAAQNAQEVCDKIREALVKSNYLGIDETGFRDEGLTKWVYATTSKDFTLFSLSDHRNFDGIIENGVLLNAAEGTVVVRDGYHIYEDERLNHLTFGRCWAHIIRNSRQIQEFEESNNTSLEELKDWFEKAKKIRQEALEEEKSALKPEELKELADAFDKIVDEGLKNSDPTKIFYKRTTKHTRIRSAMKKLLKTREFYFNFLRETPPSPSPWNGSELSGRKNPKAILELAKIANRIDLAIAQAERDETYIPKKVREELETAFFDQVIKIYEEFKDSKAMVNYKTLPKIVEEVTQIYSFFKDLQKDRDKFLLFLKDLKADISNNNTETAIRPLKRAINTSGSFRGYAHEHVSLESYISSARKQELNLQDSFDELIHNNTSYLFDKEAKSSLLKKRPDIKTKPIRKS